ncbi:microtubule-associated protein futsch-like [Anopheles maculipalpis]|uniref:microtubule-associated protein futsch-like n=1 Tax=Anopheles maculipalpis TaxID=1496333 RepID=UPI00215979DD|nr:microtubule-associated protein futsch-like [Anopheles maculipalpis]
MKPKKQQPSSVNEKKPSGSGATTGPTGPVTDNTVGTESKSTLNTSSSSSATTAPAKKPVKRLQSKTKESTSTGSAVTNTNTSAAAPSGGKSTEKILSNTQQIVNQQQTSSSKSKPSVVNAGKSTGATALASASKILSPATRAVESSKDGTKIVTTEPLTNTSSSSPTTGTAVGKPDTAVNSSGKGNKHVVKAIKSDSASQSALQNSAKASVKDTPDRSRKPTKETGSASKKSTGPTEKLDAGKRKQSGSNPATVSGVAGDGRTGPAGHSITSASIDSKLREKEKKIQKELKNLGVPDKTINQSIDAAYLLESAVESVVNPSISEMVKTKSRTTVAQGKYGGGGENAIGASVMARKSSITSEEGAEGETEKSSKETASGNGGKIKKSVTLKLDRQPGEGSKKMTAKGAATKEAAEKAASKSGRKEDKAPAGTSGGVNAVGAKTPSTKATGQGAKSNKKANNSSASSEPKQKKSGVAELTSKGMEQQKMDVASELPVVKQSPEQEGSMSIGRGSSIEQEDHEEKNEEVQIRIDSIVKALEQEDIDTPSGTKKESDAETRTEELADAAVAVTPLVHSTDGKAANDGKTKKQPAPRKPPAKKEGPMATVKSKSKEINEKKKGNAADQANKKEVKFQEQTPASPAKRKYVKKPKAGSTTEDAASGEKPTKIAKSATAKKASTASKTKQTNEKPNSKTQTIPPPDANGGTTLTDSSKDDKAVDASVELTKLQPANTVTTVPTRDRSSTENDDDVPLRQLQQKQTAVHPVTDTATVSSKDKPTTTGQPSAQEETAKNAQDQAKAKEKDERSDIGPELSTPTSAAGPILAGLLKATGKQSKRPYVRKNAASGGSGKNSKVAMTGTSCPMPTTLSEECPSKERKLEKKDVYDFDDSESEVETPVKSGKPSFKRKSSVDISQSREDISRDAVEDSQLIKLTVDDGKKEEIATVATGSADGVGDEEKGNDENETTKRTVPLKKQKRRIEAAMSESVALSKKEQKCGESSESEDERNDAADPDAPEMKTKKKVTTLAKKVKQETKDDLHSSADESDDDDEKGVGDEEEDENEKDSADSDGCSSTDTVRTRVAKKRQSAKKRNVKLYGFWSGPKRHRVASLNALAKVHCLYENEMRGALESSLMSQSSGSRVIRTITKDGERIKKERICPEEESAGEESRSGETICGGIPEQGASNEPEQSKNKEPERKDSDKKREEKKESMKQERKEAPSQQQKQTAESVATREEPKPKVKEEAPKKDSDHDSAESSEEEPVVMRNLRCAPGLRGAGKHWDPDASSLESEIEQLPDSDETYAQGKDTDPTRKRKVKKKVVRKSKAKPVAVQTKTEKADKDKEKVSEKTEKPPKPPVKKIKKELKALMTDNERQEDGTISSSSTGSEKAETAKTKPEEGVKKRKREPKSEKIDTGGDYKDYIGKKRMASLNATAMLAATYEVQRVLYRNTDSSDSECSAEKVPKTKKNAKDAKEQKESVSKESANKIDGKEKKESTGENEQGSVKSSDNKHPNTSAESCNSGQPGALNAPGSITVAQQETLTKKKKMVIKTEPMRDRKDDPMEVKREIEEPRPVSSNLVIAQDTEVTITGVYVNSTLGANQEAYCKMQYRVQQSVTEERLVRPGEAPPKSYTPLSALSSMRPPNDQTLSTPPLFVPPAQCDSPLGPPRAFYPPPTSSSGSSSAFCAPMPHDSPGYYQPAGPLISPHLLGQPPSQHGPKSGPDGDSLLQSPQQPPPPSTADSTDSDVLLTGTPGRPAHDHPMGFHPLRPRAAVAVAAAAAAADDADRYFRSIFPGGGVDMGHRSQPYGTSRYGAATGAGGPPGNLYPRPMQMHCPPAYLSPGYYAPSPYGPQPPPPHGPPPEMYYTHAYPAHFYPKFAPSYYPTSRRYYAGPGPGPEHHLYEQAPPPSSAQGPPGPPPPPSGAQLVPAGPQGPQHLDHYPYPPYPGYGSPGPGSGGQCYPRNLQHPPPPPAYMDAHYTTNCPCPMQCPKNVNAGSLIGIKASKGPVATNNHIVQNQPTTRISTTEPITISSSSSSASSSSSPAPVDSPVTTSATTTSVRQTLADTESSPSATSKQQQPHPSHAYHAHHHHGSSLPMEMHPQGVPTHHPHTYPYHFHHHHPSPLHHSQQHGSMQADIAAEKTAITATSTSSSMTTLSSLAKQTPPVVTTATTGSDTSHPDKMCYKTELPIKPESVPDLLSTPMHYGSPYHHPYHHPVGYYHHPKLTDLKEESHGALTPPYSISGKMTLLETPEMSPVRVSTVLNAPTVLSGEVLQPSRKAKECGEKTHCSEDKLTSIPVSTTIVKQEIEEFKLLEPLVGGTMCKKEDFEEMGPAMTPDLMDETIVIKKDRDEEKPVNRSGCHLEHQPTHPNASVDHHHLHHHLQQIRVGTHLPHHLHHHSASTNLLHGSPHHHHLHSHYSMQQQHQPPLITGLLVEKDESDAKLPPDSKSMLTELVLTTEATMMEAPKSILTTPSTTESSAQAVTPRTTTARSTVDVPAKMDVAHSICKSPSQQPRGTSSDNSFSLSDSLTPRVAGTPEQQLSSISKNSVKVQSHDCAAGSSLDPPSPVPIPASTVKRRPLLVACKKATPKQSPPNSYKNLIKRTNGMEGEDDELELQCPEPVELSEEEEEEEDEEEEEEEEEEDDDELENEEEEEEEDDEGALLQDGQVQDVEDIELQEQRKVEISKGKSRRLAIPRNRAPPSAKKRLTQRKPSTITDSRKRGCRRNIIRASGTSHDKLQRRQFALESNKSTVPRVIGTEQRTRSVRRYYRVFRSSIDSLKRLPISVRKRLLRRSNLTLLSRRQSVRDKRFAKSLQSEPLNEVKDSIQLSDPQSLPATVSESVSNIALLDNTLPNKVVQESPIESVKKDDQTELAAVNVSAAVGPPLSNVDRTIDLVAKGYFSEPEILSGTELQIHSRAWLKKLKQQQEGRSHSEQSRGTKCASETKKCKTKSSPLVLPDTTSCSPVDLSSAGTKGKKAKSKTKSSKQQPTPVVTEFEASSKPEGIAECKESKSKKKPNSKERKKDQSTTRKRKQKELSTGDGDDSHAPKRSNHSSAMDKADESLYQRATSTPIPVPISEVPPVAVQDDREEDDRRKGGVAFDDSVVTLMDHSSVIDDRETDFDDAATMLVEDDVASVDTNVLVNQHNNNNNSAVTDKNHMILEQERNGADPIVRDEPIQAIIAEGKEGSELEPPEGLEPFMDEPLEEEENDRTVSNHQSEALQPHACPPMELPIEHPTAFGLHRSYDYNEDLEDDDELLPKRGSSRTVKRRRSRSKTKSKKFSMKKRHRPTTNRNMTAAELEELLVPKKWNSIPRWSNGWTWEGQPFQGMVFLNSDDPPVLRTCYPAMRHSVGDIIKPRDCVLLKAGSKRAELPYVAKVAHLWENPDDGEMMMSLLWYYRPEHTEQGRQRTDGPDEVFASRHKDHNSVACIEDKCYVLTFSEYCRFRRQLKGYEENIEEQPSIVPALRRENPRLPPPIVSPELVMYCQRVYEFRQKRLLKCTS